jgi:hypothetical protein
LVANAYGDARALFRRRIKDARKYITSVHVYTGLKVVDTGRHISGYTSPLDGVMNTVVMV